MNKFEVFFQNSFDLMAIVNDDGYFLLVNAAFQRVLGYTADEMYARPVVDFLHPDDVALTKVRLKTLAQGKNTIDSRNRYRCKDGTYRHFSWNSTTHGGLFYAIGRDMTAQIEADDCIHKLNAQLESKNEDLEKRVQARMEDLRKSEAQIVQLQKMDSMGRLAGGIAHDFNNMLGAVSMYCDALAETVDDPEMIQQQIKNISEVTERAAALTKQLLAFSRKQVVHSQNVNLSSIVPKMEKMLVRLIGENIKITTRLAPELKPVSADPTQIEQVILNLVVNARDAMPQGGSIKIETKNVYLDEMFTSKHLSVQPGHYVLLSVIDNGCGMDTETLNKIFEPFFTTKELGKGTGLGLSTTYGIVKQCNGTIWVYSEIGKGSTFNIYLPAAETVVLENTPEKKSHHAIENKEYQTLLLVEDDEALREGFAMMLTKKRYKVLVAKNAPEALEICTIYPHEIDLMLTDMIMPGMNGFELGKQVLQNRPNLRILYMSGYTNDALENTGAVDLNQLNFIQKPFSTHTLLSKIQEIFERDL